MQSRSAWASATFLLGVFCASALNAQGSQTPQLVCGIEIYPSPIGFPEVEAQQSSAAASQLAGDACEDGETVYGPAQFERGDGKPVQVIADVALSEDAEVCIIATAGESGKAFLYLDGSKIAEPEAFDDGFERQIYSLGAGSHGVGVTPVGKPGGFVDVEIRTLAGNGGEGPDIPQPGEVSFLGSNRIFSCLFWGRTAFSLAAELRSAGLRSGHSILA